MTSRLHAYTFKRMARMLLTLISVLILITLCSWLVIRAFTITNVLVQADGMVLTIDKSKFTQNLLFLPVSEMESELLREYPLLSGVKFEKRFPHTLVIHLTKRAAVVNLRSQRTVYALEEHGMVVDIGVDPSSLPVLVFDVGEMGLGSEVQDPRVLSSITFVQGLGKNIFIQRISERDSHSLQAAYGNTNIFLPQTGDLAAKADTLQIIIEGFRIKGTLPAVIDLRYEKPIITN